jgi:hypothetical protein
MQKLLSSYPLHAGATKNLAIVAHRFSSFRSGGGAESIKAHRSRTGSNNATMTAEYGESLTDIGHFPRFGDPKQEAAPLAKRGPKITFARRLA